MWNVRFNDICGYDWGRSIKLHFIIICKCARSSKFYPKQSLAFIFYAYKKYKNGNSARRTSLNVTSGGPYATTGVTISVRNIMTITINNNFKLHFLEKGWSSRKFAWQFRRSSQMTEFKINSTLIAFFNIYHVAQTRDHYLSTHVNDCIRTLRIYPLIFVFTVYMNENCILKLSTSGKSNFPARYCGIWEKNEKGIFFWIRGIC